MKKNEYIVVYGNKEVDTGLIADALQDKLRTLQISALVHRVQGARYTKEALQKELDTLGIFDIIIFRTDSFEMIPKTDKQLFKVKVD